LRVAIKLRHKPIYVGKKLSWTTSQCKTTGQAAVIMFVNCKLCGWVIRIEPSRMTTALVRCESLLIGSLSLGSHGFAHPVKVDVRLVSFPVSGVRNDLASEVRSAA
jgi:hypothetical protein